ncbi:hypothetical protein [Ferrimicrobium sp.]|uniref:hypothetical protein n=1 Tax=Ferrimicrobium sp. TaxID=2926050 RepID=UPI0026344818|nr:hypothetical protein [Ferrimicrobium sp.]
MKVRNMVRGGAVVALSLGLASLGTGIGLTANESPVVQAQPGETVGGGGGGGEGSMSFSPSYVNLVYEVMQGYAPAIGTALCNDLSQGSEIDNNCITDIAPAIGNEVDYFVQALHTEPGVIIYYTATGSVSYSVFAG